MAGIFALSVDPEAYQDDFLRDLFLGTFYRQHLGEEYAGFASLKQGRIKIRTHRGRVRATFSNDMLGMEGTEGIGYCGSTREPILIDSKLGEFAACFSGNIINKPELIETFKAFGHSFAWGGEDIEIIVKLVAQGERMVDGIQRMSSEIKGAHSSLFLASEGIYAVCSPDAHWPLAIGEKKGAIVIASESTGFSNLGFEISRILEPGEIILAKNGHCETKGQILSESVHICSFLWVYTAFPTAVIMGIPASLVRKRLGAALAREDIANGFIPDIVAPVPDSGRFHAIGYHQEFCRQMNEGKIKRVPLYDEVLLKYPYAGRSFTSPKKEIRDLEAMTKILPSGEDYQGLIIVVIDDSIVRGTQTQRNLIPKVRSLRVGGIHLRIANPELPSHCLWGKTTKKGETLVSRHPTIGDRIKFLGVDSLRYNSISDLVEAIGLPREGLCVDCSLDLSE